MLGQGRPDQSPLRLKFVTGVFIFISQIAFAITAQKLYAQIPQLSVFPQPISQQTFPATMSQPVGQNNLSDFSHGYCRVKIAWGGGESRVWQGGIRLSDGRMCRLTQLGTEPDVPGTIWLDGNLLGIRSRSAKTY